MRLIETLKSAKGLLWFDPSAGKMVTLQSGRSLSGSKQRMSKPLQTTPEPAHDLALVLDEMPMRREAYMRLLGPWASEQKLSIQAGDFPRNGFDGDRTKIVIICVGGRSIRELWLDGKLWEMGGDAPPTVIISDLRDPTEIASALTWGVRGFVPTELSPQLALSTLTFILAGGDFFPSSALQRNTRS